MALSIADKIQIGKVSTHLASIDVLKSTLFGRKLDPRLPMMLRMETDAIEWLYLLNPADASLVNTSNYLYELCGTYSNKAASILSAGGTTTISTPVAPAGYIYTSLSFTVSATSTGDGSPVNNTTTWTNPLFIGAQQLTFILVDNVPESSGVTFTFNPLTGTISRPNIPFFTNSIVVVPFLRKI